MEIADVVVVGGGPGGLSAAEAIGRAGLHVVVCEQNRDIGSPVRTSGGSFVNDLLSLGVPAPLFHPVNRCRFVSPNNQARFEYADPTFCVMDVRSVYQFLAKRAILAGTIIRLGTRAVEPLIENGFVVGVKVKDVKGREDGFRCRILIDASGYQASMLRAARVHSGWKRFGVGAEHELYAPNCDQNEAILVVGSTVAPAGYGWVFPWGEGRVRVGVGIIHADSTADPHDYLSQFMTRVQAAGVDLNNSQPIEYHSGLVPAEGLTKPFVGSGIMGVGDAAGQPSALLGEGIRWAIKAGTMAGMTAVAAIRDGDCSVAYLKRYEDEWRQKYGVNLRIAYELNKKISRWTDEKWDERTEILKLLTPYQFGEALKTNFMAGWALHFIWSNPRVLKHGVRKLAQRLGLGVLSTAR